MGLECVVVLAHAMGRTLVVPPQQHLYLLGKTHKDKEDEKAHDEMGFEDMFDASLLKSQSGLSVMHMEDFLAKEGVTGGLHGKLPPKNSTDAWGRMLWQYLDEVADINPAWSGRFIALPSHAGDFNLAGHKDAKMLARLKRFGGERQPVFYDEVMQKAHHIHFPGDDNHRLLQHHYAFAFFADPHQQSFYKRFVRDFLRYKDPIQCAGHELVQRVREDAAKSVENNPTGKYYALHVRRGDFQVSASCIRSSPLLLYPLPLRRTLSLTLSSSPAPFP
jgi:GDP-fucose protein O-fucosyltransferase